MRGIASSRGMGWVTSWRFPLVINDTARGVPCRSVITWCLLCRRPRSTGEGPVRALLSRPGRASRRPPRHPCPASPPPATLPGAAARAVAAGRRRRYVRHTTAADLVSRNISPAHALACTARKRCPTTQAGRPLAAARDTDIAWPDEQAAAEPHVPTGHRGQNQQTTNRSCRHSTKLPSSATNFILKRSVGGESRSSQAKCPAALPVGPIFGVYLATVT